MKPLQTSRLASILILSLSFLVSVNGADSSKSADRIGAIEQRLGGQLGVLAIDTGTGRKIEHRATERFSDVQHI